MVRRLVSGVAVLALLAGSAGAALACPFGKSAQSTEQQTTASSQDMLPTTTTDGTKTDGTKTGG